ncbi:MAG TPA: alkaline phosphatase D family protein [Burkholderiales bacterium]|nr:alkaline phosphatase D family protein [Burkholderiales bacterium]
MLITRREFLLSSSALLASACAPRVLAQPRFATTPFTLGVASGYPHAAGMTLWTRLAPQPLAGGGMPAAPVEVAWELAPDERFAAIVARGVAVASPRWAHSVHVDVNGLEPSRAYWYRFRAGGAQSPAGRTRTAPPLDAPASRLRFALAACQQYEHGYYTAFRHMAAEELDLVVHVGDYIYESSWGRNHVRKHDGPEPYTLDEYRGRYALYKSDADLQAAHAAFPWIVTWDDHEVDNDYANDRSQDLEPPENFLLRRAAAYQAYYEHMPLPAWARPRGNDMQLYATIGHGQLARFFVLDTRQYRSHQVCAPADRGGSTVVREEDCTARLDPALTMLGAKQERWLHDGVGHSRARWNVIAQQTLMAHADRRPGAGADVWTDGWDGYPRARERLLGSIARQRASNPLVLSGDVHMAAVTDLKTDFGDERSNLVATEFVCPSITSHGPSVKRVELLLQENPHIRFANGARRGYTTLELTPSRCTARIRTIASAAEPDSPVRTLATFVVENGRPGVQRG